MSLTPFPPPKALAVCRMLLGVAILMNALEVAAVLLRIHDGRLAMPGPLAIPVQSSYIWAWTLASAVAAALVVVGAMTRVAAIVAGVLGIIALLWDQQNYSNHLWLTILLAMFLAFSRSDAAWSLRAAMLRTPERPAPAPALLMVTQLSVCYLFGALSKLNPWWLRGNELQPTLRMELLPWMYPAVATLVIVTELFIATGIWFRVTRGPALACGLLLHVSIVALMQQPLTLVTFSLACLAVYPLISTAPYLSGRLPIRREQHRALPPPSEELEDTASLRR